MISKKTQYFKAENAYITSYVINQSIFEILSINNKKSTKLYTQK